MQFEYGQDYMTLGDVLEMMYKPENFRATWNDPEPLQSDVTLEEAAARNSVREYPLTDIGVDSNDNLFIDIAVPGYTKNNLTISRKDGKLIIVGNIMQEDQEIIKEYYQQNLIYDNFERVISIDEKYHEGEVVASVENGILTIMIQPLVKEAESIVVH